MPAGVRTAWAPRAAAGGSELLGGTLLGVDLITPVAAALLAATMLGGHAARVLPPADAAARGEPGLT
jgi:uncharacterized membrane protein YphA (DoxX/SURF4 family)